MAQQFGLNLEHVKAIGYAVPTVYRPLDWQQRETFLQNRTGGKEFFLYTGDFLENEFLLMLKAFSLFKKRQQSNMQLIVAGHFRLSKNLQEKIDTYKYRQDVVLLPNTDGSELPMLTAAAYTLLFANQSATIAYPVAAAMQCGVPVIGFETNKALVEAADAAALYATPTQESLAEQMKLVYKDEALRQQLIYHTQQQAGLVNGKIAAQNLLEYHAGK